MGYCSNCTNSPCSCSSAAPVPYYIAAKTCAEDHVQQVTVINQAVGIQIQSSWNVPVCGGAAELSVPGITNIPAGAYLWHSTYGYFEVIAFDSIRQTISIQNPCLEGNAAAGSQIPACTSFVVTAPPCCEDDLQSGNCVKYDFTAPAVSDCIDIILTTTEGLIAGNNVQIGTGIYSLEEVKINNVVTICNQGNGITPGTPVIAQDLAGRYQYCLKLLTTNPCTLDTVTSGSIIVCNANASRPLTGSTVNQIPILTNTTTGSVAYGNVCDLITPECITGKVDAGCSYQTIYTDIPFNYDISFTPSYSGDVSANDLGIIKSIGVFSPGCTYAYEATVQIGLVVNMANSGAGVTWLQQTSLHWDEDPIPYEATHVWHATNSAFITGVPPPGASESIQKIVPYIDIGAGASRLMYQAFQLTCILPNVPAGSVGSVNLRLIHRTAKSSSTPPTTGVINMTYYGVVKVFRV